MTPHETAYAAFMLDYAAGALTPAERLAATLHRTLSAEGAHSALALDSMGGALIEQAQPQAVHDVDPNGWIMPRRPDPSQDEATRLLSTDLFALPWRRNVLFGVKTLPTRVPMAHLLRLNPGETAPRHAHGRRDVTVVLCGTFADGFSTYQRGDLAFAEPGFRHEPRAVGDEPCVCLLATEKGRPFSGLLGIFGVSGLPSRRYDHEA